MRLAVHSEIACDARRVLASAFDGGGGKRDLLLSLRAERAADLVIKRAIRLVWQTGADARRIDARRQMRLRWILRIEIDRCVFRVKARRVPMHVHVLNAEEHARMTRIEPVGAGRKIDGD